MDIRGTYLNRLPIPCPYFSHDFSTIHFGLLKMLHAEEEMDDDELSIFDVERCILTGEIIERQKDRDTEEWKYVIEGQSIAGDKVGTVTKLSITGKLIIITVYVV